MWSVLFINTYIVCKCHDKLVINLIMIGPSLLAGGRKGLHFSPLRITKNICICRDPSPPVCVHNVTAPAPARPQPQRTTIGQTGAGRAAGLGSTQYHHQAGLQYCSRIPPLPRVVTGHWSGCSAAVSLPRDHPAYCSTVSSSGRAEAAAVMC